MVQSLNVGQVGGLKKDSIGTMIVSALVIITKHVVNLSVSHYKMGSLSWIGLRLLLESSSEQR